MRINLIYLLLLIFCGCKSQQTPQVQYFEAQDENFSYTGRTQGTGEGVELITSASSVMANVFGDTVTIFMKSGDEQHHYVAVELNNEYLGRFRIQRDSLKFALPEPDSANLLTIYKETEASNGILIFNGLRAQKIEKSSDHKTAKIEFIGDSITCGMGADTSEINCEEGEWYDQHSAYMAYGPRVARALKADFELNCVSGMGMYRNWNDEDQPVMPDVYPYLHLNGNEGKRAEVREEDAPDIVSIALGTNDLSFGDGIKDRPEFNAQKFKENYTGFIKMIFERYPGTKVALVSSPMTGENEGKKLVEILKEIRLALADRPIEVFEFPKMDAQGCTSHPSVGDHAAMAEKLIPFYRKLLAEKNIEKSRL